ncbi:MAG: cobalamin-binding protein, partial [Chitinophagaceae bacterium]
VWVTDVPTLDDAYHMITDIGQLTNRLPDSTELINEIKNRFDSLNLPTELTPVAYLIWKDPWMTVGGDTFINDLLLRAGFKNVFAPQRRYPEVSIAEIRESNCPILFLSSEPYPFKEKHIAELQAALPQVKIQIVDGELFSWYGSRLLYAPAYFKKLQDQLFS